jgi:hypothetical protein
VTGHCDGRVDADDLARRAAALGDFVQAADGIVDERRLAPARELSERAGQRLALSRDYTVVALAGATGSGKSSLFNALSGLQLSDIGPLRPTTARAHACVWGSPTPTGGGPTDAAATGGTATMGAAGPLLDWLGVPESLRFARESALDAEDEAALRGLVLLDLPDFDSLAAGHGRPGGLGDGPAEVRRPGDPRAVPADVPPAPGDHPGRAQPGGPVVHCGRRTVRG